MDHTEQVTSTLVNASDWFTIELESLLLMFVSSLRENDVDLFVCIF